MSRYFRFNNRGQANGMLNLINSHPAFPITGNVRGVPAPQNKKTERWDQEPEEFADGKWGFPELTQQRLNAIGMSDMTIADVVTNAGAVIETRQASWEWPRDEEGNIIR